MSASSVCPPRQDLERYTLGQVANPEAEQLDHHLQQCAHCAATLHELHPADTLLHALQTDTPLLQDAKQPEVTGLIERLKTLSPPQPETYEFLEPPQQPDEIGRLGRYRVLRPLGSGGMGVVFLAEECPLQRLIALKVMKPALAASAQARRRFLREAKAAAALEHEHIVPIYHSGEERGVLFLAFQFLKGESLEQRLRREGKLPVAEVLQIGRETAAGLDAAHSRGLIHRDIKPSNLWLEERGGRIKILDFGLARLDNEAVDLTQTDHVIGTPAYMSPEQARGARGDQRSDLFSFGVVLYQLCTGKPPFQGDNPLAILESIRNDQPPAPRALDPAISAPLSNLIMKLLAKDPAARPATAREVATTLRDCETNRRPASPPRLPRLHWVAAAVLILGSVMTAVFLWGLAGFLLAGPLDRLDPANIPETERRYWHPNELVAVIGQHQPPDLENHVGALAFSPNGQQLLYGHGKVARLWDFTAEREVWNQRQHDGVGTVAFAPDGQHVVVSGWHQASRLLEADTGKEVQLLVEPDDEVVILTLAFSPDGRQILVSQRDSHDGLSTLWVWDVAAGRRLHSWQGDSGYVTSLAWLPDNRHAFSAGPGKTLRLWDVPNGREVWSRDFAGPVDVVACSTDGRLAVSGDGLRKGVQLWDMKNILPEERSTFQGHLGTRPGEMARLAVAPNGRMLATSDDSGKIIVWEVSSGKKLHEWQFQTIPTWSPLLAFAPDSRHLAVGNETGAVYILRLSAK